MTMKQTVSLAVAALMLATASVSAQTAGKTAQGKGIPTPAEISNIHVQGGPGIVISGSQVKENLPDDARKFLDKFYPGDGLALCREDFIKNTYHVILDGGTDMTFDHKGKVRDIRAAGNLAIPAEELRAILPAKTVRHLDQAGVLDEVTAIKDAGPKGFGVALLNNVPPQMIFDVDGTFIITAG